MPRCFSTSIQSEVAWRADLRAFTVPASWIAPPNSSSFSVSVVLPASGWAMMAKVRRFSTSRRSSGGKGVEDKGGRPDWDRRTAARRTDTAAEARDSTKCRADQAFSRTFALRRF